MSLRESAASFSCMTMIDPRSIALSAPIAPFEDFSAAVPEPAPVTEDIEGMPLAEMERRLVVAALRRTANDVPRAAAMLEINPSTIYRKLAIWRAVGASRGELRLWIFTHAAVVGAIGKGPRAGRYPRQQIAARAIALD